MLPDGHQHQIRAPVLFHPAGAVEKDDGQPAHRQQKDQAGVGLTQLGNNVDAVVKGHAHDPHQQPITTAKTARRRKSRKSRDWGGSSSAGSLMVVSSPKLRWNAGVHGTRPLRISGALRARPHCRQSPV